MARITKKSNSSLSWFNNVAKSLGYSSSELVNSIMPSSIEFVSSNISSAKDVIRELRNMRSEHKRLSDMVDKDGAMSEVRTFMKNALDDLKTGKFYNKERENALYNFGDEDFSFSDEFGIDDDLFKEDDVSFDDNHITINKNVVINNMAPKVNPMMKALESQTKAIIKSTEATNNVNISLATKKMIMDRRFGDNVLSGLTSINENISLLVNFQNDSMSKYISASLKYYEENLNVLNRTLEEIKKTTTEQGIKLKEYDDDFNTALLANNALDIKGYLSVIKKNTSKAIQDNLIASMIADILKDKEMRDSIIASPLKFVTSSIVSSFLPGGIRKSMGDLDKSFSNFFPALFMKVNRLKDNHDNPLLQLIGQIFGVETKTKTRVDPSSYNKGPVPFDGYTRRAVIEVIPTYLRKILAAISDSKEMFFDYGKGEFRSKKDINEEFTEKERSTVTNSFSEVRDELLQRMDAIYVENEEERKEFRESIDKFLISLTKQDKLINPRRTKDRYGFDVDELEGVYKFGSDEQQKLFRQLVLSLPRNLQMQMFGSDVINARRNLERFYRTAEENYMETNAMYLYNKSDAREFRSRKGSKSSGDYDDFYKYNSSGFDIYHEKRPGQKAFGSYTDISMSEREIGDQINTYLSMRDGGIKSHQKGGFLRWIGGLLPEGGSTKYNEFLDRVDSWIEKPAQMLKGVVDKIDYTLYKVIFGEDENEEESPSIAGIFLTKMKKTFSNFSTWMSDKIFTPLHDSIFGENGIIEKFKSSELFQSAKGNAKKFVNYLFGESDGSGKRQGGLFSDTANHLLDIFDQGKYYFIGKGYTNRSGVSFPDNEKSVFGEMKSMFGNFKNTMKEYLFGKDKESDEGTEKEGVFSKAIKNIQMGFNNFAEAIFGPKMIGDKENKNYETIRELTTKVKERAPKAFAYGLLGGGATLFTGGNLGLLGSLFLPGGPLGGAIVGTAVGFLSQSDRFKDWLFGPEVDGERTGGVINKEMQNFFKEHKASIVGGAALGAAKSMFGIGLLPSFLLPGGPIGGAIAGMGFSMLRKSKWFNELLFGTEEDGKKVGGIFSGIYNKIKTKTGESKNLFGNMGAGALGGAGLGLVVSKFGLLGSMLLPGGPLGGALLGTAAGFALSSEKWRKVLFGEFDEDEQIRKGGILGKFINWTKLELFDPIKLKVKEIGLNIQEWFTKSIANPFLDALDPIKHEISKMVDNIKSMFKSAWDNITKSLGNIFEKHVAEPLGKFMAEHVLDPMKSFMKTLVGGIGKIFGSIISSPFKMINSIAMSLQGKHEREGVRAYREREWSDIMDFKGRRERGEKLGFFGGVRRILGMYTDREAIEEAKYSEDGASYAREASERKIQREEKQNQIFAKRRAEINIQREKLNKRILAARGNNYADNYIGTGISTGTHETGNIIISEENIVPVRNEEKITVQQPQNQSETTRTISTSQQPIQSTSSGRTSGDVRVSRTTTKPGRVKNTGTMLSQITDNVKIIAQEVKGQLDGVGGNTYKIRRILQKQYGVDDSDLTGSANKDRIGLFGKLRRALFKPFDSIKEMIMKPVKFLTDTVSKVGNALLSIPKNIFNTFKTIGREVFSVVKDTMSTIVRIPLAIVQGVGEAAKIAVEGLKMVGPAISGTIKSAFNLVTQLLKSFGTMLHGAAKAFNEVVAGIGSGIGSIAKGLGETAGALMSTFGKMLGKIGPMVGDLILDTTKQLTKFTFNAIGKITHAALEIIKSPFKLLGGLFNKVTGRSKKKVVKSEVKVLSGTLDRIKKVDIIKDIIVKTPIPVKIISTVSELPVRVVNFNTTNERFGPTQDKYQFDLTKAFSTALEKFDESDDKEEEEKRIKLLEQEQLKVDQKHVTRKTASFIQRSKQELAEKVFVQNNEITQTSYLKSISDNMKEYKTGWVEMFGKKGLLFACIMMAVPVIKKIWEWVKKCMGWGDDDGDDYVPSNFLEAAFKGFTKKGIQIGAKVNERIIRPLINFGKKTKKRKVSKIFLREGSEATFEKGAKEAGEKIAIESLEEITEKGSKIFLREGSEAIFEKGAKEAGEKIAIESLEEITEKGSKNVLKFIIDLFKKIFSNKKVRAELGEEVAEKAGKEVIEKITKSSSKTILQKIGAKLTQAGTKIGAKTGSAAATAGITEAIFASYNLITGAIEAHRLFDVHPSQVDDNMRKVSSVIKTILGFGWNFVIEIINEVFKESTGVDFIKLLAMIIYKFFSKDIDYEKLLNSQNAFEREVQLYNKTNQTDYSIDEYQDKYYKSVAGQIGGGLKWALIDKPYEFGMKLDEGFNKLKDGFFSDDNIKKNLGITGDGDISKEMKASSALSELLEFKTFGLIKSEKTASFTHGSILTAQDIFGGVTEGVDEGIQNLKDKWNSFLDGVEKKIVWIDENVFTPIKDKVTFVGEVTGKVFDSFVTSMDEKVIWLDENVFTPIKDKVTFVGEVTGKVFDSFVTSMDEKVIWLDEHIFTPITDKINGLGNFIKDIWDNLIDFVADKFGWVYSFITGKSADDLKRRGFEKSNQSTTITSRTAPTSSSTTTSVFVNTSKKYTYYGPDFRTGAYAGRGGTYGGGLGGYPDRLNNFTYFSQNDDRWAQGRYEHSPQIGTRSNNPTIGYRGCGPTAMAMVATELTGKVYDPPYFARIAEEGGHSSNQGTSWSFFDDVRRRFGFDMYSVAPNNDDIIKSWLSTGMPIILSGQKRLYSKSPFTPGGHFVVATGMDGDKILINDPRGTQHSGEYSFNNVMREMLGGWAFRYDGRTTLPENISTTSISSDGNRSMFDIFGDIGDAFQGFRDLILYGKLTNESRNTNVSLSSPSLASFAIDYTNPAFSALKTAVLKKALETTVGHESSGNYAAAKNDISSKTGNALSPSIGILQWRVGNAKALMDRMYEQLPNDPEAKYFAKSVDWYNEAPWSEAEQKRLRDFLQKNYDVTKKVQDQFAMEYMAGTNFYEVEKHAINTGKLKDPRAIAFLTNFANTGPALVKSFMDSYTPGSVDGSEFDHFYNEFLSKSYWGQRSIYKGRINTLYNDLKNWDPGVTGGYGEGETFRVERNNSLFTDNDKVKVYRENLSRLMEDAEREIKSISTGGRVSDDILIKIIALLEDISGNTRLTSEELSLLNRKESKVEIINTNESNRTTSKPPTVVSNNNNYSNPIFNMVEERRKTKQQKEYKDAKDIAKGR